MSAPTSPSPADPGRVPPAAGPPGAPEHELAVDAQRFARLLTALALVLAASIALAYACAGPALLPLLRGLMRMRVAHATAALAAGMWVLGPEPLRRSVRLGASLAAVVALALAVHALRGLVPAWPAAAAAAAGDAAAAEMAPMAALLTVLAALLLLARLWGVRGRLAGVAAALAYAGTVCALAALCAHVYAAGPVQVVGGGPLILPAASLCLTCLFAAQALWWTPPEAMRDWVGRRTGAILGRRLALAGTVVVVLLGLARVQLQRSGLVGLEIGTASLVIVVLAGFVASLWVQSRALNRLVDGQERSLAQLRAVTAAHGITIAALGRERTLLRSVLQAAVDYSIVATDAAGRITVFSDGASRLLGHRADAMVGRATPMDFHDAEEVAACAEALGVPATMEVFVTLVRRYGSDTREWTYLARAGRRLPVALSVSGIFAADGSLAGLVGVARDLTATKRAEQQRERLFGVGQELLCIAGLDGCLRHTNPQFARIVGYSAEQLVGRPYVDFVHPDDRAATIAQTMALARGIAVENFENRWRTVDGSYRHIAWRATPDLSDGTIVAGGRDVTADKQRALELARQIEFEQQLIGIVSHDLRNPVNAITLSAGLLARRQDLPPSARRGVARITTAGSRAERMLHDLLDFTQSRRGGSIPIAPRATDADALVHQVVDEQAFLHPERRIQVRGCDHGEAWLDADRVAQALGNLLSNAVAYSPPGTAIVVSMRPSVGGGLTLEVRNQGAPIPAHKIPGLFRPLRRGSDAPSGRRSVGLGLYIVEQIARAHGGRVEVSSTAPEGTRFAIILPQASKPPPAATATAAD